MNTLWPDEISPAEAASTASAIPCGSLSVSECRQQHLDRQLGYFGKARYAFFYYEPRGEEVVWNDGRTYGFGCGGWRFFLDEIAPLGQRYGVDLGDQRSSGRHVLLVDRRLKRAYFTDRDDAEALVAAQHMPRAA